MEEIYSLFIDSMHIYFSASSEIKEPQNFFSLPLYTHQIVIDQCIIQCSTIAQHDKMRRET